MALSGADIHVDPRDGIYDSATASVVASVKRVALHRPVITVVGLGPVPWITSPLTRSV